MIAGFRAGWLWQQHNQGLRAGPGKLLNPVAYRAQLMPIENSSRNVESMPQPPCPIELPTHLLQARVLLFAYWLTYNILKSRKPKFQPLNEASEAQQGVHAAQ
jgi:hypothetical protein